MQQRMSAAEVQAFLAGVFPQFFGPGKTNVVESAGPGTARVRFKADQRHLRPGGTVSGPTLMALADSTMYVALLATLGPVPLAVTTSLSINFLRKPELGDILAECKLLKLGRRLAVGEISIRTANDPELVAHAVATYSIPPDAVEAAGN